MQSSINRERKGAGKWSAKDPLNDVVPGNFDIDKVLQLLPESNTQLFHGLEPRRITALYTDLFPSLRIHSIVKGNLQHFHQVKITC